MKTPFRLALLSCSLLAPLAFAQEGGGRPPHRPPPEALQACASLSKGAACSVTFRGETLTGTCEAPPEGTALACRPTTMPRPPDGQGPRHAPPREAVSACSGLKAEAACAFTHDGNNLTGTCVAPPGGASGSLACRPDRMPPPPGQ